MILHVLDELDGPRWQKRRSRRTQPPGATLIFRPPPTTAPTAPLSPLTGRRTGSSRSRHGVCRRCASRRRSRRSCHRSPPPLPAAAPRRCSRRRSRRDVALDLERGHLAAHRPPGPRARAAGRASASTSRRPAAWWRTRPTRLKAGPTSRRETRPRPA